VASTPDCSTRLCRAGRSRTCLVPRIRRLPCRPAPGPISSKVGRIRTHSAGFGDRLLSQEHNLVCYSGRDRSRTCKGLRLARVPGGCHRPFGLPFRNRRKEWESNPQGLAAHLFSRQAPSPIGSSFRKKAVPVGLEPTPRSLTGSRTTVVLRDSKSGWSDLNRRSPAPQAGGFPGFPTS
jgi:hypothetical protein